MYAHEMDLEILVHMTPTVDRGRPHLAPRLDDPVPRERASFVIMVRHRVRAHALGCAVIMRVAVDDLAVVGAVRAIEPDERVHAALIERDEWLLERTVSNEMHGDAL